MDCSDRRDAGVDCAWFEHEESVLQTGESDELNAQLVTELVSTDVVASVAFYQSLGFTLKRQTRGFAVLQWGKHYLFLCGGRPAADGELPNIRVVVSDVDEKYRQVVGQGMATDGPPESRSYGLRDFTVFDPNGYGIRFAQIES